MMQPPGAEDAAAFGPAFTDAIANLRALRG